jgi:hypothetical protein
VDHSIVNFVPFSLNSFLFFFFFFVYFVAFIFFVLMCMSVWVGNSKDRLETSDAFFGSYFDTPTRSPTYSIMAEERERVVPPRDLPCASIEPHATFTVEVPSKMSVGKEGEKTKFFERHKTKRKALQDTRRLKKLLNSSKGVALHVVRMKSAKGSNYSFGGSRSGG